MMHSFKWRLPEKTPESETLLSLSDDNDPLNLPHKRSKSRTIFFVILALLSAIIGSLGFAIGRYSLWNLDDICTRHTNKWCK